MIIDTSALLAILLDEQDSSQLREQIAKDPTRLISVASELEAFIVIDHRYGPEGVRELDLLLHAAEIESVPVTGDQIKIARQAYRQFGKGHHPAALNFGDCFPYALARTSGEPLLFVGNDFVKTDVQACLN